MKLELLQTHRPGKGLGQKKTAGEGRGEEMRGNNVCPSLTEFFNNDKCDVFPPHYFPGKPSHFDFSFLNRKLQLLGRFFVYHVFVSTLFMPRNRSQLSFIQWDGSKL